MSSDNPQTPPGELGIRRVVNPSSIDLAHAAQGAGSGLSS